MKARLAALVIALGLVPGLLAADPPAGEGADLAALPPYQPQQGVAGTIRLWGHGSTKIDFMGKLVKRWEDGFRRYQPGVRFDYRMYGTASAIGALYAGAGDLALMGEEVFPFEAAAYERVMHHPVSQVEIATGSLDVRNFDFAQVFFVNRNNPISRMTLAQLDAQFPNLGRPRPDRRMGGPADPSLRLGLRQRLLDLPAGGDFRRQPPLEPGIAGIPAYLPRRRDHL